jgi:hypothetical protein
MISRVERHMVEMFLARPLTDAELQEVASHDMKLIVGLRSSSKLQLAALARSAATRSVERGG